MYTSLRITNRWWCPSNWAPRQSCALGKGPLRKGRPLLDLFPGARHLRRLDRDIVGTPRGVSNHSLARTERFAATRCLTW